MNSWKQSPAARWLIFSQRPSVLLLRLFAGRMFKGGGELGADELELGMGVVLIFLAMPGVLASLLMFEKYGSLIRFLRGDGTFDPFIATIPDEYFFIVLSMSVSCAVALWRWNSIFLDRRDYTNLVPLPISLTRIFFANLFAIFALTALLTFVVNAASFVLFPVAVLGSEGSFSKLLLFAFGHAVSVSLSSVFSFLAVFALSGTLMACFPYRLFRKISVYARFAVALILLTGLATSVTISTILSRRAPVNPSLLGALPPVWFLGLTETLWGRGHDIFFAAMTRRALIWLDLTFLVSVFAYAVSFRRSFVRIPEFTDVGPLPRAMHFRLPAKIIDATILREPKLRACFHFVSRTLLRSDAHLQIVLAFAALGLVVAAQSLTAPLHPGISIADQPPSIELISIPFILSYCLLLGIRLAFEVPLDLSANWIFKLWIDPGGELPRQVARRVLLTFSLGWLAPLCFLYSAILWGWLTALLQTSLLIACSAVFVEVLLVKFRKIPFTCSYPPFESNSPLYIVAYLVGFALFAIYIPRIVQWSVVTRWGTAIFIPLVLLSLIATREFRKQMLDMDKQLIFEEESASGF
ncbi:MAG TPA: hypothetical protein VIX11_00545 [Candidatus Acidoferrum sp.]